jgi:hypothetical protein
VNRALAALLAVAALAGARVAREAAATSRPHDVRDEPYAPSPTAAPIVALGYRELAADVLWVRLRGYFGDSDATAPGIEGVVDAIVSLDPRYHWVYEFGARAMTMAQYGVTQETYLHALAVLDRGMTEFPDEWKLPDLAGEIYTQDLVTKDPAQRRAWDEKGVIMTEAAIRKPGAPPAAATWAATMRTKLGQQDRAIQNLREMILITSDPDARDRMIEKLAKMVDSNKDAVAGELGELRYRFVKAWQRNRPTLPPSMYVLLGPRPPQAFELVDLATGGRDLVGADMPEPLEPLD